MARSVRTLICTSALLLAAGACGSDGNDNDTNPGNEDGSADGADGTGEDGDAGDGGDGSEDGSAGEDGSVGEDGDSGDGAGEVDLAASCDAFCTAQAECLQFTEAQCTDECMSQAQLLTALDCTAEGAAENECMASLTCDELRAYATQGKRTNEKCGAVATDYFAACTVGESAECTAMCEQYDSCGVLQTSVGACEESCLLRIANLTWSVDEGCANAFVDVASCIATASCEDLTAMTANGQLPESCAAADQAQAEACGG